MSLTRQLLETEDEAEAPLAAVAASSSSVATEETDSHVPSVAEAGEPKTAAGKDAKATAAAATKFASLIQGELEKTASEGGSEGSELAKTLLKAAHYITELLEVNDSKEKYARGLLKEAGDLQTYREAVKLAGELMASGQLEVPEDYNVDDVAVNLMKEDLRVVKRATQFANAGKLGNLGQAAPDKALKSYDGTSDDGSRKAADDQSFLDAHGFLLTR